MMISEVRNKLGLTQKQFAELIKKDRTSVVNWEKGHTSPSIKNLKEIADILNINIEELI